MPVYEHIQKMAEETAIMANVDYKISLISGIYKVLVNRPEGEIMQKSMELLEPITYTDEEMAFGKKIQEVTGKPQLGMNSASNPRKPRKSIREAVPPIWGM